MNLILTIWTTLGIILTFGWFIPTLISAKTAEDAFKALNKLVGLIFALAGLLLIIIAIWGN